MIRAILFSFATMLGLGGLILILASLFVAGLAWPRDLDGRYANSPLKPWFNQLASKKGLCCSFADGVKIEDVDWDTQPDKGAVANAEGNVPTRYRVRICAHIPPGTSGHDVALPGGWIDCTKKEWVVVPDAALITEPNRFGPAVVWPYFDGAGDAQIRCFMPGAGT